MLQEVVIKDVDIPFERLFILIVKINVCIVAFALGLFLAGFLFMQIIQN